MPEPLSAAAFASHLEQAFKIDGVPFDLVLTRIETYASAGRGQGTQWREPFTLMFAGPKQPVLCEGLHEAKAASGAIFALYLMPIQTFASDRQEYQAAFN